MLQNWKGTMVASTATQWPHTTTTSNFTKVEITMFEQLGSGSH